MAEIVLEAREIIKQYPNFKLGPISLALRRGTITGCIGRNGAGKSTAIKVMTNLINKDAGSIILSNSGNSVRNKIGYLGERRELYQNVTLASITRFIKNAYKYTWNQNKYFDYMHRFHLKEHVLFKHLSTGNKVRYLIALELSKEPEILFLDEPTSGLDPIVRDDILQILKVSCQNEGLTVFLSSHITEDIERIADSVIFLKDGKILLDSSIGELNNRFIKLGVECEKYLEDNDLKKNSMLLNDYYIVDMSECALDYIPPQCAKEPLYLNEILILLEGEDHD